MNNTIIADAATLDWGRAVRDAYLLEHERVTMLPEFQEWAQPILDTGTGAPYDWNLEDCIRKWVEHNRPELPECPTPMPSWAQTRTVDLDGPKEIVVRDEAEITIGDATLTITGGFNLVIEDDRRPDDDPAHWTNAGATHFADSILLTSGDALELEIQPGSTQPLHTLIAMLTKAADLLEQD